MLYSLSLIANAGVPFAIQGGSSRDAECVRVCMCARSSNVSNITTGQRRSGSAQFGCVIALLCLGQIDAYGEQYVYNHRFPEQGAHVRLIFPGRCGKAYALSPRTCAAHFAFEIEAVARRCARAREPSEWCKQITEAQILLRVGTWTTTLYGTACHRRKRDWRFHL